MFRSARSALACSAQVADDRLKRRVAVQVLQFCLKQVLSNYEARIAGQGVKRRMGLDRLVELFVRRVGNLAQALRTQSRSVLIKGHRSLPC